MVNRERLCEEFFRLASIASPSLQEGEIARYLQGRFEALGAQVVFDDAAHLAGGEVGNLIARFAAVESDGEPLMLSVHMDMVEPAVGVVPQLKEGVFTSVGETVLGADDKAGIAEIIEALEVVHDEAISHPEIEVVVTIGEEIGLVGAKHLDYSRLKSRRGFALDTSGVDRIILTAPGANRLRFEVTGRESHAGIAPEEGLSAIVVAAKAVAEMPLGRIDEETTANIGTIKGGLATNIIPRTVVLHGEARSHNRDKLAAQTEAMQQAFIEAVEACSTLIGGELCRPEVRCEVQAEYPQMVVERTSPLVLLAEAAAQRLQRQLAILPGGGGSDANIFNEHGIETAILGSGMEKVHSVDEYVTVDDLERVSQLLVEIIRLA
ncbi:MAG: peptidase M20 [Desulfuromonas sp.]|nr:MAG: peptidase M20 [Desulfuromonas sp.]